MPVKSVLSELGVGTYRPKASLREVLSVALRSGCRFIDTAPNYGDGWSHLIVGEVLRNVGSPGRVLSKVGFVPANHLENLVRQGIISKNEAIGNHVLTPKYIAHQVQADLERLGIGHLDCLFLHNPETRLSSIAPRELLSLMVDCFRACADLCKGGLIGAYGIATWHGLFNAISLTEILEASAAANLVEHFRCLQLPISLVNCEHAIDYYLRNSGPLYEARQADLQIFASSPLHGGKLPSMLTNAFIELLGQNVTAAQGCLQFVRSLEVADVILFSASSVAQFDELWRAREFPQLNAQRMIQLLKLL